MSLFYADRIKQNAFVTGTGLVTLAAPIASYNQFVNAGIGTNSFPYAIINSLQFEVGVGTYGTPADTGTTYGVIYRNLVFSVSTGDTNPVNFNGNPCIAFITNPSELSLLVSNQPSPNTNKIIKWTGSQYDLIDPIENGASLGTSINNSVMFYNASTTNYDADANLKFLPGSTPELYINGVLQAIAKAFKIPYPNKPEKFLQHGCLEGPEYGIYLRGTIKAKANSEIIFPDYFMALGDIDNYTISISSNSFMPIKIEKLTDRVVFKLLFPTFKEIEIDYLILTNRTDLKLQLEV
jgi:hypothetical protein